MTYSNEPSRAQMNDAYGDLLVQASGEEAGYTDVSG